MAFSTTFENIFQAALNLGMTGENAIQWVINTAEYNYPTPEDQDDVFNSVIKGLIGVQPYLGGGAVYDEFNTYWKSLDTCPVPGCDDPLSGRNGDLTKYSMSDYDLSSIMYGAYQADVLLTYVNDLLFFLFFSSFYIFLSFLSHSLPLPPLSQQQQQQ